MRLEDILVEWEKDSQQDSSELAQELSRIPYLHHKYLKIFTHERIQLAIHENKLKQLYLLKLNYYRGNLDQDTIREQGWEPFQLKLMKEDIPTYINADQDYSDLSLKLQYQKEKVAALESIIKHINNLGYNIKSQIDWLKFTNGS